MFVRDEELAQWEVVLPDLQGLARLPHLAALAWHLRQRNPAQSRRYAAETITLLTAVAPDEALALRGRLLLATAETAWVSGELDTAQYQAGQAMQLFEQSLAPGAQAGHQTAARQRAARGRADGYWIQAWVANDRGDSAAAGRLLVQAAEAARAGDDPLRVAVISAATGVCAAFTDWPAAQQQWQASAAIDLDAMPAIAAGWLCDFFGTCAFQHSEYGRAIGHLMRSFETALGSGQIRRAIIIATNIGNAFTCLNAHEAALDWMQRGQDLARPTGWPLSIGMCLMQTAETLRQLGQREAAQTLLREALQILAPLAGSRAYAVALEYEGDLALDLGNHAAALNSFTRLVARGDALGQRDFQSSARRGQAHALSHLGRAADALAVAQGALALASEQGDALAQIAALNVLADIHARQPVHADTAAAAALPLPPQMTAPSAPLHYLLLALEVAATIDGYAVPGALLEATAREYAAVGNHERAYALALQAGAARGLIYSREATNRAIAMQVQYQTERAQTESEHHRQLAAAEALRAEVLQRTSATLEHLSAVGQEITAHLNTTAVFRALDRHVQGLLDATHFSILLIEPEGGWLVGAFAMEAGRPLPAVRVALDDPRAHSARCVRERRELLVELDANAISPSLIPGTLPTLSMLFAPLRVGERLLGVMTVQSLHAGAYGERERLIFRTLCAYGAIALDNASAYRQVAATQEQLLEKNIELERAYQALEEVSLTDQLTGLRNRRFFLRHVDADVAMSLRAHETGQHRSLTECDRQAANDLVFYMVDLDHFKQVNDRYGHAAGDAILVQMQQRLREVFRESDYVIRWGGEEFLVLARATHREDASALAERMRRAVAERDFVLPDGELLRKTCSIGFACFPFLPSQPRLLSWSQVVELADQGLYVAKRSGRNAWAALYANGDAQPSSDELFARLMHALPQAVADGEVQVLSSLQGPLELDGERRRTGLSIDLGI
ncbi:MAG: sensor domain-containing diguanylate cyclase [Duganella sp.]